MTYFFRPHYGRGFDSTSNGNKYKENFVTQTPRFVRFFFGGGGMMTVFLIKLRATNTSVRTDAYILM